MQRRDALRLGLGTALLAGAGGGSRAAEVNRIRLSHGYGVLYLPLIVMRERKLLEAQLSRAGLGTPDVTWQVLDGGNVVNDAMLASALDIAGGGAPGFLTLWARALAVPNAAVVGVSGLSTSALVLATNKPHIKTLADFKPGDRIAIPGVKTSLAAVVLQMACAKEFGPENYNKLDPLTVSIPHPDALIALLSGRTEIAAHFAAPPFSTIELRDPRIHKVVSTPDLLGDITLDVVSARKRFADANPNTMAAFVAALDEANELIGKDPKAAAAIFATGSPTKVDQGEVVEMLADPDMRFSAVPHGVMQYAEFMNRVGTIKAKPASWKELFIPAIHGRAGS